MSADVKSEIWFQTKTQNIEVERIKYSGGCDQTPACGGLRRRVKEFREKGFIEVFVTAILLKKRQFLRDSTWIVGGDGRFYFKEAFFRVISVMAGYGVGKIITAKDGILTAPAMCLMVKKTGAIGGILLSANFMPAGPRGYFGLKYIIEDGSSASDKVLRDIYGIAGGVKSYNCALGLEFPLSEITSYIYGVEGMPVAIIIKDAVRMYADYMKNIFDYHTIRAFLSGDRYVSVPFKILVDCMNGAVGPYVKEVLEQDLGVPSDSIINDVPQECYATGFPSPLNSKGLVQGLKNGTHEVGFAMDNIGFRVMVMGRKAYQVYPSDTIAILAEHLHCIPYFQVHGVKGYAKSLPTSNALKDVAEKQNKILYQLPVDWMYFFRLLRTKTISFCGDCKYGVGSSHLPELDGIWGMLAWLSVMEHLRMPVRELLYNHWNIYGRYFTAKMIYEAIKTESFFELIEYILFVVSHDDLVGRQLGKPPFVYTVLSAEVYDYPDPTNKVVKRTSFIVNLDPGARIIYRTTSGKTTLNRFKIFLESKSVDPNDFDADAVAFLAPLAKEAIELVNLHNFFDKIEPSYML